MQERIKISVIVPFFNVEKFIGKCAGSLMRQTLRDGIEFLFIDDGSTDNSAAELERALSGFPERKAQIRMLSNDDNRGTAFSRERGLQEAQGEFVVFCDADDRVEPPDVRRDACRGRADRSRHRVLRIHRRRCVGKLNKEFQIVHFPAAQRSAARHAAFLHVQQDCAPQLDYTERPAFFPGHRLLGRLGNDGEDSRRHGQHKHHRQGILPLPPRSGRINHHIADGAGACRPPAYGGCPFRLVSRQIRQPLRQVCKLSEIHSKNQADAQRNT